MYLIVGANGFVGSYVIKQILEKTNDKILAADKNIETDSNTERITWIKCDITKHEDLVRLNLHCSEQVKIVYLAAFHKPDQVLAQPHRAWNINVTALSDFLNTIENVKCLFYSSTEMVYGAGERGMKFKEDAVKEPVNAYGKNKVVAESLVVGYGYNVVRFPFLIGPSIIHDRKHFYDIIVDTILEGKAIEMFEDALKTALDFNTLAEALVSLIEQYSTSMPSAINIAGDEALSKYEIGLRIARKYGVDEKLIVPISVKDKNDIFVEKRADCTLLDNTVVKKLLKREQLKIQI